MMTFSSIENSGTVKGKVYIKSRGRAWVIPKTNVDGFNGNSDGWNFFQKTKTKKRSVLLFDE